MYVECKIVPLYIFQFYLTDKNLHIQTTHASWIQLNFDEFIKLHLVCFNPFDLLVQTLH